MSDGMTLKIKTQTVVLLLHCGRARKWDTE